jgi:ethanolamine ammonia-lyase large subunit
MYRASIADQRHVFEERDWLLSDAATGETLAALAPGLMPEMAAAVCKISRLFMVCLSLPMFVAV